MSAEWTNGKVHLAVFATTIEDREGRDVYRWTCQVSPGGPESAMAGEWMEADLRSGWQGVDDDREMLESYMSFLGAALEGRAYLESENEGLFPADMLDALRAVGFGADEATMVGEEVKLGRTLPPADGLVSLVDDVRDDIDEESRADEDATEPSILLTVGWDGPDRGPRWGHQTGDMQYTGGAYGFRHMASVAVARDSDSTELATELRRSLTEASYGQ